MSWIKGKRAGRYASARIAAPLARNDELVVEEVADEVLIYDQRNNQAHCLSSAAGRVWRACDGRRTDEQLGLELELDRETVARALAELDVAGLLATGRTRRITRREATTKMAKVGAVAASAPLIYSIIAPAPALANSQNFCVGLGCVPNATVTDACGFCHQNCCACCGPGNSTGGGAKKLCTADCSATHCYPALINAHCNTTYSGSACNLPGSC